MKNDNQQKSAESPKTEQSDPRNMVSLPRQLVEELHAFIALSNNTLMNIPVCGDQILESAKVMNMAIELNKKINEVKNEQK